MRQVLKGKGRSDNNTQKVLRLWLHRLKRFTNGRYSLEVTLGIYILYFMVPAIFLNFFAHDLIVNAMRNPALGCLIAAMQIWISLAIFRCTKNSYSYKYTLPVKLLAISIFLYTFLCILKYSGVYF